MKNNKKAEFDIQKYLITFLLFSGIIVTLGSLAYTMGQDYNTINSVEIDGSFSNTYNKIGVITGEAEDMQSQFEQADVGNENADAQFLGGALKTVKISFQSIGITQGMIQDIAVLVKAPQIWSTIFKAIIVILMVTTILFMIFKSRG